MCRRIIDITISASPFFTYLIKTKMSLFSPLFAPVNTKIVRELTVPTFSSTKALIIPVFDTLLEAGDAQIGGLVYIKSLNSLRIGTSSGWSVISDASSTLTNAPGSVGQSIIANGSAPNLSVKGIAAGSGVIVSQTATDVVITGTATSTYTAGADISIVGNTISNTSPGIAYSAGTGVNLSGANFTNLGVLQISAGNNTISLGGSAQNPIVGGNYQGGSGISIVGNTINVTSNGTVLTVTAGDSTVVTSGTASNPQIAGNYLAGTGITIAGNSIQNAGTVVGTISNSDSTLLIGGTVNAPTITGNYQAGTNISIVGNVISAAPFVSNITAGDAIVTIGGVLPTRTVALNYAAGTNISITGGNIINSTLVGVNSVSAGNNTIVIGGTGTNPNVRCNYVAGAGITISGVNIISVSTVPVASITAANTTMNVSGVATTNVSGNYTAGTGISIVGNVVNLTAPPLQVQDDTINYCFGSVMPASSQIVLSKLNSTTGINPSVGFYLIDGIELKGLVASVPLELPTFTVLVRINGVITPMQIVFAANQTFAFYSGSSVFAPAGSMLYVTINTPSVPGNSIIATITKKKNTTNAIAAPTNPSGLSASSITTSSFRLAWTIPSGTTIGYRIAYKVGSIPSSWNDPTAIQIPESAIYNNAYVFNSLLSATTYGYVLYSINGNTPPTMSATFQSGTTTTL